MSAIVYFIMQLFDFLFQGHEDKDDFIIAKTLKDHIVKDSKIELFIEVQTIY